MRFTDNRSDSGGFRNSDGSSAEDCSAGGSEDSAVCSEPADSVCCFS